MTHAVSRIGIGLLCIAGGLWAQDAGRGHWSGGVELPNQSLAMEVDLDKTSDGWIGSISIPAQNASGMALEAISIGKDKCTFRIKGAPGEATFTGALSEDGKTLSGDFTQGGGSFPFKFTRNGDPKVEKEKASPPVTKEFVGNWEGTLEGPGLRLVMKISNEGGQAKATLVSVDQGGSEIPASAVQQKDAKLTIEVKSISGQFEAEINKSGTELTGTWTQLGNSLPLRLTKSR